MKIIRMEVGSLGTNCYIVYCTETLKAVVIDPGGNDIELIAAINRENLQVEYIINTHGHADHIAANSKIKQSTGAKVLIHKADAAMLTNAQLNLSSFIGGGLICEPADRLLEDGNIVEVGALKFHVLHTPGHTPGGICLKVDNVLFSGDTLFAEGVGRTDFPGGSYSQIIGSIRDKLLVLADETKVYPGHGPETTIDWEKKMNPFIQ